MGVKGQKLKHYSGDFKCSAVEEVLVNHMGLRETARKYAVTHKMVQTWIKLYLEKGKDYLYNGDNKHKHALIDKSSTSLSIDHTAPVETRKHGIQKWTNHHYLMKFVMN
ncbi:transposase [Syntrophomonas curvata]